MNFINKIVLIVFAFSLCLSACSDSESYMRKAASPVYFDEVTIQGSKDFDVISVTDSDTGCKLYASRTYLNYYSVSQKFRSDGKPDCPDVQ